MKYWSNGNNCYKYLAIMEENRGVASPEETNAVHEESMEHNGSTPQERRGIRTVLLCAVYFVSGFALSPIGPTLPNMEVLLQTDTSHISMALSTYNIGYLIGCLVCAALFDRINPDLQLSLSMCIVGTSFLSAPWSANVYGFAAAMAFTGLGMAYIESGVNAHLLHMWHGHHSQKQLFLGMQVVSSVGTMLAPYVIRPFLVHINHHEPSNCSSEVDTYNGSALSASISNLSCDGQNKTPVSEVTSVRHAYSLVGSCVLCVFVLEFILWCSLGPYLWKDKKWSQNKSGEHYETVKETQTYILTGFMFFFFFLYIGTHQIPSRFVALFVTDYLAWPVRTGAVLTIVYWGGQGLGTIAAVPASYVLSSRMIVYVSLFLICLAYTLMLFISEIGDIIVYISVALGGFAASPVYANSLLWVSHFIKPSAFLIGTVTCALSLSGIVMFPLSAYCFDTLGYMWFVYIVLILGTTSLVFFIVMDLYANFARKPETVHESVVLMEN